VFAYGATGSGKSFTLFGNGISSASSGTAAHRHASSSLDGTVIGRDAADQSRVDGQRKRGSEGTGVVERAVAYVLEALRGEALASAGSSSSRQHPGAHGASAAAGPAPRRLALSAFELYGDEVRDLLAGCPGAQRQPAPAAAAAGPAAAHGKGAAGAAGGLAPGHDASDAALLRTLLEVPVADGTAATAALAHAISRRAVAATASNDASSRSHCVVRLTIRGPPPLQAAGSGADGSGIPSAFYALRGLKLRPASDSAAAAGANPNGTWINIVDLAGCERVRESRAAGTALAEACAVNASLAALGDCVAALVRGAQHVPFRNSKVK
jgi:hypothetical protein